MSWQCNLSEVILPESAQKSRDKQKEFVDMLKDKVYTLEKEKEDEVKEKEDARKENENVRKENENLLNRIQELESKLSATEVHIAFQNSLLNSITDAPSTSTTSATSPVTEMSDCIDHYGQLVDTDFLDHHFSNFYPSPVSVTAEQPSGSKFHEPLFDIPGTSAPLPPEIIPGDEAINLIGIPTEKSAPTTTTTLSGFDLMANQGTGPSLVAREGFIDSRQWMRPALLKLLDQSLWMMRNIGIHLSYPR